MFPPYKISFLFLCNSRLGVIINPSQESLAHLFQGYQHQRLVFRVLSANKELFFTFVLEFEKNPLIKIT